MRVAYTLASRESVPALTTIHQDAALRARTAIRRLEALRDGTPCDAGIVLPVELVERESTRRLPCQTL
ncbi:MAG: substrate-binding domain-containing protein [Gemmiger qucibialis]